jgi:hypothetical protein
MKTRIDIRCSHSFDEKIAEQIRLWAEDIIERLAEGAPPDRLKIHVYHRLDELQNFFRKEKDELGIVSEGEAEFIAIHEAWRGYPRIHICAERIKNLPEAVVLGAVQHELAHAILHGRPEFYTFRFSRPLISASEALGFDIQWLQQCVYLLSIALKDGEVVSRLVEIGFQCGQIGLLEHMLSDTRSEHDVWNTVRHLPPQRKIAVASFLKILLPVVTLTAKETDAGRRLRQEWEYVYDWLSETERLNMMRFATATVLSRSGSFQDRLEQTALKLITDPRL